MYVLTELDPEYNKPISISFSLRPRARVCVCVCVCVWRPCPLYIPH